MPLKPLMHCSILRINLYLKPQSLAISSSLHAVHNGSSLFCSGVSTDSMAILSISIDGFA